MASYPLDMSPSLVVLQLGSLPVAAGGVLSDQCAEVGAQVREAIKLRRGFLITAGHGELLLLNWDKAKGLRVCI